MEDASPTVLAILSEATVTSKSAKGEDIMTDNNTNDAQGYEQPTGPNADLKSRFYDSTGNTLD